MSAPIWTILIPTIPKRAPMFVKLMERLLPQTDAHGDSVRVVAWLNDGAPRLAEIRDRMIHDASEAGTEYVSFVDDDDMVTEDYVDSIMGAMLAHPGQRPVDHIGFRVFMTKDGQAHQPYGGFSPQVPSEFRKGWRAEPGIVEHSLKWKRWGITNGGMLFRDFTHIDPIRTMYASAGRFAEAPALGAEDRAWVKQVRPFLKTEAFVEKVLYHYRWVPADSAWDRPMGPSDYWPVAYPHMLDEIDHPNFAWHPEGY